MSDSRKEGRFLNAIFNDLPLGPMMTREEQTLRATTGILRTLQSRLPSPAVNPYPASSPRWETLPPNVVIDVPDTARSLHPYFDELSRGQFETTHGIQALTGIGQQGLEYQGALAYEARHQSDAADYAERQRSKLLSLGRTQVMLSEALNEGVREASLAVIGGLHETRDAIQHIGKGIDLVDARIFGLEQGVAVSVNELRQHTKFLDEIAQMEGRNADSLFNIQCGVNNLAGVAAQTNYELRGTNRRLDAAIVIGAKIADFLARMDGSLDLFVLNMSAVQQPLNASLSRAERYRRAGQSEEAANLLQESMGRTPSDPHIYYSLAMLALETGTLESARKFFTTGYNYALRGGSACTPDFLWQMGKLAIILGHNEQAEALLEHAHSMNRNICDIWYDLALVSIKLGNRERTIYLLNNLLYVATRQSGKRGYVYKVLIEPFFKPILSFLNR